MGLLINEQHFQNKLGNKCQYSTTQWGGKEVKMSGGVLTPTVPPHSALSSYYLTAQLQLTLGMKRNDFLSTLKCVC
jgi:hypothetical protein